jgi:hypothetical protein
LQSRIKDVDGRHKAGHDARVQTCFNPALAHDPEKGEPVFGKDHAQTKSYSVIVIQLEAITL